MVVQMHPRSSNASHFLQPKIPWTRTGSHPTFQAPEELAAGSVGESSARALFPREAPLLDMAEVLEFEYLARHEKQNAAELYAGWEATSMTRHSVQATMNPEGNKAIPIKARTLTFRGLSRARVRLHQEAAEEHAPQLHWSQRVRLPKSLQSELAEDFARAMEEGSRLPIKFSVQWLWVETQTDAILFKNYFMWMFEDFGVDDWDF